MMNSMGLLENELRLPLVPARLTTFGEISAIVKELNIKY
jgi:4-hydroxy-tetrahydrodipicolinate synthase